MAPDLIGVALGALAAGAAGGAGAVTLALAVLRTRLEYLLPLLVFGGIVTAAALAWRLAAPITDWWRRGLTAVLAVFGALMLTALSAPADRIAGITGLLALAAALLGAAGLAARHSVRSRARDA
ncbi:MAG TPA: hypothetical protein VGA02_14315 [Gemmatimonadales bacterium]